MLDGLFAFCQERFHAFVEEFRSYGLEPAPDLELRRGEGLICSCSREDGHVYLALPDPADPVSKLQTLFLRSLLGCQDDAELAGFLRLFLPYAMAHELCHHYRMRYGLFGEDLWLEEQIANQLACAVTEHRMSPAEREAACELLSRALRASAAAAGVPREHVLSYHDLLQSLVATERLDLDAARGADLVGRLFSVPVEDVLRGVQRLASGIQARPVLIERYNDEYTGDVARFLSFQIGWMLLDLRTPSRSYVGEVARRHFGLGVRLLPAPALPEPEGPAAPALRACHAASRQLEGTARRYFYKRYRARLLRLLERELPDRSFALLDEHPGEGFDPLELAGRVAPERLTHLFPEELARQTLERRLIGEALGDPVDARLWRHAAEGAADPEAAATLELLTLLHATPLFRSLPVEFLLALARLLCPLHLAAGETLIWAGERDQDVYLVVQGELEVLDADGRARQRLRSGNVVGEFAFFTQEPRVATVRAAVDSECFAMPHAELRVLALRHPAALLHLAGVVARRVAG